MLNKFLKRPVFTTVCSILIIFIGFLGLKNLPIELFPQISPPTVQVDATYEGANAQTVLNSVLIPLEEQINGVEGMTYMTSSAGNDGYANINIRFHLGVDPDLAAIKVQNRVSAAIDNLPVEVVNTGVVSKKSQIDVLMFFTLYSENPDYDEDFLYNYAEIYLIPEIQRIEGIGKARAFGERDYAMRIWLDPIKMANHNVTPQDIQQVLNEQNVQAAPGKIGENGFDVFEYTLNYPGQFSEVQEYEDIVVKVMDNQRYVLLKDVARVELGVDDYSMYTSSMGHPGVGVGIFQISTANANDLITQILALLEKHKEKFPQGVHYNVPDNVKLFLDSSIHHVKRTLFEAFILVFLIVFIFLQDIRTTIIPTIVVPISIIGTFFFLNLFGFSINILTLFAMVLAIGIVVDDAIVVVEAVHSKLDQGEKNIFKATQEAISEIYGAIISITLIMASVFIPVSFIKGPSGIFYKQFGITLAIAIFISAFNALTLSPVLCSLFLRKKREHSNDTLYGRVFIKFENWFQILLNNYQKILEKLIKRKEIALGILIFCALFCYYLFQTTPKGFVPNEDRGIMLIDISTQHGTNVTETKQRVMKFDSLVSKSPLVDSHFTVSGFSLLKEDKSGSFGFGMIKLIDLDKRKKPNQSIGAFIADMEDRVKREIPDIKTIFLQLPIVRGYGASDGFEIQIQDESGTESWESIDQVANNFIEKLLSHDQIDFAITTFDANFPQYSLDIDVLKAKLSGVEIDDLLKTMQGYFGGIYASNFNKFGKQYRVQLQAYSKDRSNIKQIDNIFVRNKDNKMIPISSFVRFKKIYKPEQISRFNMLNSAQINGKHSKGYSSNQAIKLIDELAKDLPPNFTYDYSGLTRAEVEAGNQALYIFLLCLIFVYFLLCMQYESYILPLSIIFSLLIGVSGAILFIHLRGIENNIYFQISLIMLIGLLSKNAILIVEFARQRRIKGMSVVESAIQGAKMRFRPILMTSFAFIFGIMPLFLSTGIGYVGNRSISTGAVGGMLIGTVIGVFVVPVLFIIFQNLQEKLSFLFKKHIQED